MNNNKLLVSTEEMTFYGHKEEMHELIVSFEGIQAQRIKAYNQLHNGFRVYLQNQNENDYLSLLTEITSIHHMLYDWLMFNKWHLSNCCFCEIKAYLRNILKKLKVSKLKLKKLKISNLVTLVFVMRLQN